MIMRAFLVACLAMVAVATGGYFLLGTLQEPSGMAFSTDGARIDTNWSWRSVPGDTGAGETAQAGCTMRETWQWAFVDFRRPKGEAAPCWVSQ
jgi:hypothetical protein